MRKKEDLLNEIAELQRKLAKCENKLVVCYNEQAELRRQVIKKRVNRIKHKLGMP